ncbi:hypothetical protein ACQ4LE_005342 [Meloidogyne hapla]
MQNNILIFTIYILSAILYQIDAHTPLEQPAKEICDQKSEYLYFHPAGCTNVKSVFSCCQYKKTDINYCECVKYYTSKNSECDKNFRDLFNCH